MQPAANRSQSLFMILIAGLVAVHLTACSSATSPTSNDNGGGETASAGDGKHDSFMAQGKADHHHEVEPGSPEAEGILELVNTASFEVLDDDVALDVRAAEHIVERRRHSAIETLQELDDVLWVGSRAFGKLYAYAEANGYFDSSNTIHGIEPDSREAWAVLRAANLLTNGEFEEDVGISQAASDYIVDERVWNGIENLGELAAIQSVTAETFSKFLSWVDQRGWTRQTFHGYDAGSPPATGIVRAANAPEGLADFRQQLGFSQEFATEFRTYRNTRTSGGTFELLAQIDRIEGADRQTFDRLHIYAEQHDLIPETYFGVREDSYAALEILEVANEKSEAELDDAVALDSRAASNIVDERPFQDLGSLVDVSYVAETALEKMASYARSNGVNFSCGDGNVQSQLGEECDDGNSYSGDGCSFECRHEQVLDPKGDGKYASIRQRARSCSSCGPDEVCDEGTCRELHDSNLCTGDLTGKGIQMLRTRPNPRDNYADCPLCDYVGDTTYSHFHDNSVPLGRFQIYRFTRECEQNSGGGADCEPWQSASLSVSGYNLLVGLDQFARGNAFLYFPESYYSPGSQIEIIVESDDFVVSGGGGHDYHHTVQWAQLEYGTAVIERTATNGILSDVAYVGEEAGYGHGGINYNDFRIPGTLSGSISDVCLRLSKDRKIDENSDGYTEERIVIYSDYHHCEDGTCMTYGEWNP